jgi:CelD/BcsL family acetyltransferase involved in cellulose biosynthesis
MLKRRTAPLSRSEGVPDWWARLFEATGCRSIFLSAAWLQSWIETYADDFEGEWLCWEVDGRIVGGCLLLERTIRVKGMPLRSVFLNATGMAAAPTPLAEFNDVLHVPAYREAIGSDLALLLMRRPWSRCFLSGYEEGSLCAALAESMASAAVEHETRAAPYVDIAALEPRSFDAALSGSTGTQVRKNRRLYESQFGPLAVRPASSLDEALQFFEEMSRLHLVRWEAQGESSTLASPLVRDFHHRLIRRLWAEGQVELVRVGSADTVIGYLYNYVFRDKVFFFQSGFDYQLDPQRSPGMLTHVLAVEHYRQRELREYDFLAGDARYKRSLANRHRALRWSIVYKDQLWARAFLLGRRVWSRLAERKAAAPQEA